MYLYIYDIYVYVESPFESSSKFNEGKLDTTSNSVTKTNILLPDQKKILKFFGYKKSHASHLLTENELHIDANHPCPEIINHDISIIQNLINPKVFDKIKKKVFLINQSWTCTICNIPQYKDMIECEICETWYHWICISTSKMVSDCHWICSKCDSIKLSK
nr:uncharacterized protein LOC124809489 [Hydra vulgaris]